MATYREIQQRIRSTDGFVAQTCWIADVLAGYGITKRIAHNRIDNAQPAKPCPPNKRSSIEAALKHFGMI